MQIFFLSDFSTITLFCVLWFVFQFGAAFICLKLPDRFFSPDSFLFKERKWERTGKIYSKVFRVNKWKGLLPDGGAMIKGGYSKKNISDYSDDNLKRFAIESCRAELTHLLAIFPFWVFGLLAPIYVVPIMFLYSVLVNLPCILAQRYNRPRVIKILKRRRDMKRNHN